MLVKKSIASGITNALREAELGDDNLRWPLWRREAGWLIRTCYPKNGINSLAAHVILAICVYMLSRFGRSYDEFHECAELGKADDFVAAER